VFGEIVRDHRRRLGLTQEELAGATGLSVRSIGQIETGAITLPRPSTVRLLADAFGLAGAERERFCRAAAGPERARPAGRAVPRQLPSDVPVFAGRRAELARLDALLRTRGPAVPAAPTAMVISAVSGTAGVGKTALAVHWAHRVADRFPDGQLYVNLRGYDPSGTVLRPESAIRQLLEALHVPAQRIPSDMDAQTRLYRSVLADTRTLVVLDNARDPDQVRPLLPAGPGCVVLITSRSQLAGLVAAEGAQALDLDHLTVQEARELLARRIGAPRVAADPGAVDAIIASCARLPLALAIVAARVYTTRSLSLAALAEQLSNRGDRLDALSTGDAASTDMRAAISWSYDTLGPAAARLLRLLGLDPGPDISAAAATSLAGLPPAGTRRLLAELTRAHLVVEHVPDRFAMHDLLRTYAAEEANRTDSDDERQAAVRRLLDHYLHTAHAAVQLIPPPRRPIDLPPPRPGVSPEAPADHEQARAWFAAEHRTLLGAVEQSVSAGLDGHTWRLAWALEYHLDRGGHWHDQLAVQHAAVAAAGRTGDAPAQAKAGRVLARAYIRQGCLDEAYTQLRRALDLDVRTGERIGQSYCHQGLATVLHRQGRYLDALDHAHRALDGFRAAGHRMGEAIILDLIGWNHAKLGDHPQTLDFCQQALTVFEELDDPYGRAVARSNLGYAHHHLGNHRDAGVHYEEALAGFRRLGDGYQEADVLTRLGDAHDAAGRSDAARAAWREAVTILDQLEHPDAGAVRAKLRALDVRHA
jgi:tetratricopeptide (TPR) repeat protein/transcriptional regulator with XRE-family HTH domain